MFITAVCVLFLIKLRWPKTKSLYDTNDLASFCAQFKQKRGQKPLQKLRGVAISVSGACETKLGCVLSYLENAITVKPNRTISLSKFRFCKNLSNLQKWVTPGGNGSHLAKSVTLPKRCHTCQKVSHMAT